MALAAMVAGLMELPRVPEGDALRDTYIHMGVMLAAFSLFVVRLLEGLDGMRFQAPDTLSLLLDAAGFIALAIGGWLGGRLVYGHGIGRCKRRRRQRARGEMGFTDKAAHTGPTVLVEHRLVS